MASQPFGSQPSASRTIHAAARFFGPDGQVVCDCGKDAARLTSSTSANPGREFWNCRERNCKFFKWDDQLPLRPGLETPTPSQPSSLSPATSSASQSIPRTSPHIPATPVASQDTARTLSSTPSPRKRPIPEPASEADRAKRKGSILAALKQFSSSQTLPATPPSKSKFKPAAMNIASGSQPPLPAPDFGAAMSSRASDAGSSYTIHGDLSLSADELFGTPARPSASQGDILTPPDTGKTQRISLPEVDNSPLKGKGKAADVAAESDDEWNMLDDTIDLEPNTQSTTRGPSPGPSSSLTTSVPSTIDFEHLFDDLGQLPTYIRSLQAENARLKEELAREKTKRINAQQALRDALDRS